MFRLEFMDQNAVRFQDAVAQVGDTKKAHNAFRRAINHTGAKAKTQVVRSLAKQMGLPQRKVREGLSFRRANFERLEYTITGQGRAMSLKEFGAKQFGYGVRAKPWGRSQRFAGAFIFAGTPSSGQPVAGGHVFKRTDGWHSTPIEKLYGPSIPKEMVKDASAAAFERTAGDLGARVGHELRRLTGGVVG
jgi:hypothetical protein